MIVSPCFYTVFFLPYILRKRFRRYIIQCYKCLYIFVKQSNKL